MTTIPVEVDLLDPHPDNPRLDLSEATIDGIRAQIKFNGGFHETAAPVVRQIGARFQIVEGHHRVEAARREGLAAVPCQVVAMGDDEAFMRLRTGNIQTPLRKIEEGRHLAGWLERHGEGKGGRGQNGGVREYARGIGVDEKTSRRRLAAWSVLGNCGDVAAVSADEREGAYSVLVELAEAPKWLHQALVTVALGERWDVKAARTRVAELAAAVEPPRWVDRKAVAYALVTGSLRKRDLPRFDMIALEIAEGLDADLREASWQALHAAGPSSLQAVRDAASPMLTEQDEREAAKRETLALRDVVSLERWGKLAPAERAALLAPHVSWGKAGFNRQENDAIEWAQWSWNPVTGCKHDCPYCYARDIATSRKMANAYPHGFEPAFRPRSLLAPRFMEVPGAAHEDVRHRNVFVCSMADLFGRWVPDEWIAAVLDACRAAPDWNFLFLTKFPKRMAEFDLPPNGWFGTTVDLQARVPAAEAAFAKVRGAVRWLSVEPMLEPLSFKHLERFDWVVIGGASRSSKTPAWRPPFEWIVDLVAQARAAGCRVYFKTNLLGARLLEAPDGLPVVQDAGEAPEVFRYLGGAA